MNGKLRIFSDCELLKANNEANDEEKINDGKLKSLSKGVSGLRFSRYGMRVFWRFEGRFCSIEHEHGG